MLRLCSDSAGRVRGLRLEAPSRSGAAALWAPAQGYGRSGPAAPPRSLSGAPFTCWPHWLGQPSRYGIAHLDGGTHRAAETAIAEAVEAVARSRRGRHRAGRAEEIGRSEQEGAPVCRSVVTPRPHASKVSVWPIMARRAALCTCVAHKGVCRVWLIECIFFLLEKLYALGSLYLIGYKY